MVGGTVNLASRLEHEAPPGGVLISFETYAQVKDEMRCEERGRVQVKGIAQPVATYAVIGLKQDAEQAGTAHLRLELESTACPTTSAKPRRMRCAARSDCSKTRAKARTERFAPCPLLALSGHRLVRCTCPLLGAKRT